MISTYIETFGITHFKAPYAGTLPIVVVITKTFGITRTLKITTWLHKGVHLSQPYYPAL